MPLSPHRLHKIYLAASMEYGLPLEDPEELAYYNPLRGKIVKDRKNGNMGVKRND